MSAKRRKVRILWGRVFIAVFIVAILIIVIITVFPDKSEKPSTSSSNTQSMNSSDSSLSSVDNTINANYDFKEFDASQINKGNLILVNGDNKFLADAPDDLVTVYSKKTKSYQTKDAQVSLKPEVITALNKMADDFFNAKNNNSLMVISGYRTFARQQELYDAELKRTGLITSNLVALPGHSEHHTGYAVDFGIYPTNGVTKEFDGTGDFSWIDENSYKYGFVVRYRKEKAGITKIDNEPWHFRYVGQPHAYIMQQKNLSLEEYIDYLRQFEFGRNNLEAKGADGADYEIYYVKSTSLMTKVPVPKKHEYSVSGNNVDGFIVTVKLS